MSWHDDPDEERCLHTVFNPDNERLRRLLYDENRSHWEVVRRMWGELLDDAVEARLIERSPSRIDAKALIMRA